MNFDVIVIGGGHAGCEAAAAASRVGANVALITKSADDLGKMSCNPAIGGLGKGQLVREIDALDGLMARAADAAGIQFRLLNRSKGAAVQGPRVQADRSRYASVIRSMIEESGVVIVNADVEDLLTDSARVIGVSLADGRVAYASNVVVTTGTFLGGMLHVGELRRSGGRINERSSSGLIDALCRFGLRVGRFKTGTPPRIDGRTIDWAGLNFQPGDAEPAFMSELTTQLAAPQIACAVTRTTSATHDLVRQACHQSPAHNGAIVGQGPRYCPSIEDKILRFGDRDGHQIFLEPEGLDTPVIYPNGISTALPAHVQTTLVHSIPGLERAKIARFGYAVEYSYCDPTQLDATLAVKSIKGLFLAGQINGTTGYEEAAAQGVVAGINAARAAAGSTPFRIDRADGYIGVLIDDLVTRGVTEPYRMFTSRAEFRLALRVDNASERLTALGVAYGCVGSERANAEAAKSLVRLAARTLLKSLTATPTQLTALGLASPDDGLCRTAFDWLRFPEIDWPRAAAIWPELHTIPPSMIEGLTTEARYAPYIRRQRAEVASLRRDDKLQIPRDLDFREVAGLSIEAKVALEKVRPESFGAAGRLSGLTPAGLTALLAHVRRAA